MTDKTTNNHTTADDLARAHAAFHGNWDNAGVTMVYLPRAIAEKVLADHGWRRDRWRGGPGPWLSPTGDRIWDTDEAVALTIAAQALTETQVKEQPTEERRLRDLVTAVLQRDPSKEEADEVVIERLVATEPGPVIVAASDHRLVIASLPSAPNQRWHQLADRVISAIDATSSNTTNDSKRPDGR
jgi:hypothetical protein